MAPKNRRGKVNTDSDFTGKVETKVHNGHSSEESNSSSDSSHEHVTQKRRTVFQHLSSSASNTSSSDSSSSEDSDKDISIKRNKSSTTSVSKCVPCPNTHPIITGNHDSKMETTCNTKDLLIPNNSNLTVTQSVTGSNKKKKNAAQIKPVLSSPNDIDSLLAEFSGTAKTEELIGSSINENKLIETSVETAALKENAGNEISTDALNEVSAKTLKNRLKKMKKKQTVAASKIEVEIAPATSSKVKAKSAGPMSVAARLAQQRLQILEAEQRRQEEEARELEELEKKRLEEEEEEKRKELEEKEKKRLAKLERKEKLRREGKPVTAAEKERARKAEMARLLLLQQMNIHIDERPLNTNEPKKKSRVITEKKKKKHDIKPVKEAETIVDIPIIQEVVEEPVIAIKEEEPKTWEDLSDWDKSDTDSQSINYVKDSRKDEDIKKDIQQSIPKPTEKTQHGIKHDKKCDILKDKKSVANDKLVLQQHLQNAELRSPICCILGHVDTGKTKLLDKIRHTDVQAGEAGGITQQIGATFFPRDALWEQCKKVDDSLEMRVPGLLIIDTPGHESFNNLRARGSSLCDIAILVVDIMHGLEPQTKESLEMLRARKCPFIVALNKIDRIYGWVAINFGAAKSSLMVQAESAQNEFSKRASDTILQLAELGLNCAIWWDVDDVKKTVSVAPTSAITGEGIPDLLYLLVKLTQNIITKALVYREEFQCTILEVKAIEGLGTTIDVVLVSGTLFDNDKIIVCGMSGPIVTTIRALLTPQPLKELRVKGEYIHHKQIKAAMGVKISAQGLEDAVAGTSLLVARNVDDDELEQLQEDVMADINHIFKSVDRSGIGVYVMASTLGSLEALLQFLSSSNIPVFAVNLGPVHKLDVKKASVMREKGQPEYSCILAFDVKVDPEAIKDAQSFGVKIFTADIIYHLFDDFNVYVAEIAQSKKKDKETEVVFPCILSIYPNCIFNKKDPIVLGVKVEEGIVKVGTPLIIPEKDKLFIGRIASLEHNKKSVEHAKKGDEIAIKITGDSSIMFGRHFDHTFKLYSRLTRDSIDCLKEFFRDELKKDDWKLVLKMKKVLDIA